MDIIRRMEGCPGPGKAGGCYGPVGTYYTVFGSEMRFLYFHMWVSIILGLVLFAMMLFLYNKGKIRFPFYLLIIIPLIIAVILFFILAYLFPVRVMY